MLTTIKKFFKLIKTFSVTKYTILCSMARKQNCKKNAIKAVEFENKCLGAGMNAETCKKLSENILFSGAN